MPVFRRGLRQAFSLAELLVVIGVLALLLAITVPPLQFARRQAQQTRCASNLQQHGRALGICHIEENFYPLPDDGGSPIRYTWIDVLIQSRKLVDPRGNIGSGRIGTGYCPSEKFPDNLNSARNSSLLYPPDRNLRGIDYSYGIGVPLAMGGWALRGPTQGSDNRPRQFRDWDRNVARRILAADAYDSGVYNVSGNALSSDIWNDPTQYDNTVAWKRHGANNAMGVANALFQDYHVSALRYFSDPSRSEPINTAQSFLWQPNESIFVNPNDRIDDLYYPNQPPPHYGSTPPGETFPNDLNPVWYTTHQSWTLIIK